MDHWRCRFRPAGKRTQVVPLPFARLLAIQSALDAAGMSVIKSEGLYYFRNGDGTYEAGFSMGQGE